MDNRTLVVGNVCNFYIRNGDGLLCTGQTDIYGEAEWLFGRRITENLKYGL